MPCCFHACTAVCICFHLLKVISYCIFTAFSHLLLLLVLLQPRMSDVWNYFEKIRENGAKGKIVQAKCNNCKRLLAYSTSGQKAHLKMHNIDLDKLPINEEQSSTSTALTKPTQSKITTYFPVVKHDTLIAFLAKLAARRGIPFSTIASEEMTMLLKCKFKSVPTSDKTVAKYVQQFATEVKSFFKYQLS